MRRAPPDPATGALSVVLVYALFAGLWILLSDRLMAAQFRDPAVPVMIGFTHSNYGHIAMVQGATRDELAKDL